MSEHDIDVKRSYMIGDRILDIEAGKNIGAKSILILTPHRNEGIISSKNIEKCKPDYIADDFENAVEWILKKI